MKKILIVDDEYLVRELIKRSINWEELECHIAGEASGGMEALDMVEELQPDIVITDICMPIMDGIKLSSLILDRYPQIKVVVLTGHDEFVYAKESVSIGVKEYLLKPVNPTELKNTVIKISVEIEKERSQKDNYSEVLPYLREKTFNDLMSIRGLGEDITESIKRYGINFYSDNFQVALIKVESPARELFSSRKKVFNTIKNHFVLNNNIYCFLGSRGFIVLLSHDSELNLEVFCNRIINNVVSRLGFNLSIGLGREAFGYQNICNSYDEASQALEYQVVEGFNSVISFNDIGLTGSYDSVMHGKLIKELNFSLKAGLGERFTINIEDLFKLQVNGVGGDIDSIRVMASNILSEILSVVSEQGLEVKEVFSTENQPYEKIFKETTLPSIIKYLNSLGERVINQIKEKNCQTSSKLITGVKKYLKDNLADPDIQLCSVADKFFVNSSYLSRKFKQECGETFMEHLAFLRIDRAIELLKNSDKRSYEIADEIGINDPHYFSIFFKKKMKMSISDYKKQLKVK